MQSKHEIVRDHIFISMSFITRVLAHNCLPGITTKKKNEEKNRLELDRSAVNDKTAN